MEVTNNKKASRFEAPAEDGNLITLEYRWLKGSIVLMHTLVPPSARGTGAGSEFVKQVLDRYVRNARLKMIAYCPFVTAYLERHPEYKELLDTSRKS